MTAPLSKLHISSYERKFGTWRTALEQFIDYMNSRGVQTEAEKVVSDIKVPAEKLTKIKADKDKKIKLKTRTNRIANLRQRFRVMKRDNILRKSPYMIKVCSETDFNVSAYIEDIIL
ncbi:MAG: hypothetical protein ACOCU8_02110 [Patescibacteria group bacterium]